MYTLYDKLIEEKEKQRQNPFEVKPYNPSHAPWNYSGLHLPVFPPVSPTHDEVNFSHEEAVKMLKNNQPSEKKENQKPLFATNREDYKIIVEENIGVKNFPKTSLNKTYVRTRRK